MIHKFKAKDVNILLDVNSGGVHVIDDITYDMLDYVDRLLMRCPKDGESKAFRQILGRRYRRNLQRNSRALQ